MKMHRRALHIDVCQIPEKNCFLFFPIRSLQWRGHLFMKKARHHKIKPNSMQPSHHLRYSNAPIVHFENDNKLLISRWILLLYRYLYSLTHSCRQRAFSGVHSAHCTTHMRQSAYAAASMHRTISPSHPHALSVKLEQLQAWGRVAVAAAAAVADNEEKRALDVEYMDICDSRSPCATDEH